MSAAGQWVPDPGAQSGWRWDDQAPPADQSATNMLPAYAGIAAVPVGVFDPDIGGDGGGRHVLDDPPPEPVADLGGYDPRDAYGGGTAGLAACPTCGTGVHPDRIRG
jgi:hypothetical protein